MENIDLSNSSNLDPILTTKKAKALILTLALGILVCLGLIIYTLITHNLVFSFLDGSLFKPGLLWLGFIGFILSFVTYLLFRISTSIFLFLPNLKRLEIITTILGIITLSISFIVVFISYDIENSWTYYVVYASNMMGLTIMTFQEVIRGKFQKIAKIWNTIGLILIFIGVCFLAGSL